MAKNDFQHGGWNSYTLQCGTIMTLISPGHCTLQCGMWLWNRDREFTKWQHPLIWYVALGWHAIEFAQTSAILLENIYYVGNLSTKIIFFNTTTQRRNYNFQVVLKNIILVRHIGILHLVSISTTSPQSTCYSAPVSEITSKSDHPRQKKMMPCRFLKMADLSHLGF